ncbi:MAG: beta-N-acetylhexosaminidase [Thermostichales cyanobacterium GMQP_bins_62]
MHPSAADYAQARQWLDCLSLEAQVGQLLTVFFQGTELSPELARMIQEYRVGGLILYAENTPDATTVARLIAAAQGLAPIPLWIAIDQEGGEIVRLRQGVTAFPAPMAVAAAGSLAWAEAMSYALGSELRALGINLTLAPVLDVNSNPANPIIGLRSFGSNPQAVAAFALATLRGYERAGILCCGKHFPGHGDTSVDSHLGLPRIDHPNTRLQQLELVPFQQAIQAGIPSLMTAHVLVTAWDPQTPATLSSRILKGRLRDQLGFEGLIITDSLSMGALEDWGALGEIAVAAVLAGADMLLLGADVGHTPAEQIPVYEHLLKTVQEGGIPRERLQEAVLRLLAYKCAYGLGQNAGLPIACAGDNHQQLAQTIAEHSLTLLPADSPLWQAPELCFYPEDLYDLTPYLPGITLCPYRRDESAPIDRELPSGVIWIFVHNLGRFPQQRQLVTSLPQERTLVINTGSPYDLADLDYHRLLTYGYQPLCLAALTNLLNQRQRPQGHPVF